LLALYLVIAKVYPCDRGTWIRRLNRTGGKSSISCVVFLDVALSGPNCFVYILGRGAFRISGVVLHCIVPEQLPLDFIR